MDRTALVEPFASFPARLAVGASAAPARPARTGEWGPAEVVRHLIEVERVVWRTRFASIIAADEPAWSWTEPGLAPDLDGAALPEFLGIFAAERVTTATMVRGLSDSDWRRTGVHATYRMMPPHTKYAGHPADCRPLFSSCWPIGGARLSGVHA